MLRIICLPLYLQQPTADECSILIAQDPEDIYSDIPQSAEDLRRILAKVNLWAWLPNLLCPPPAQDGTPTTDSGTENNKINHDCCREVVETALATQPRVEVSLVPPADEENITIR